MSALARNSRFPPNPAAQTDHRFPYVAGHRYEFRVVPSQGVELAIRGSGDGQRTSNSQGSKVEFPAADLQVVFSVTSSYAKGARLRREDAAGLSLPTFEAPGYNSQQPKQPQTPPAATRDTPPTASVSCHATDDPPSAVVQRPPSSGVAAAIIAPSQPQVAPRATVGTPAPTAATPVPPAVPKALVETWSNRAAARTESGHAKGFEVKRQAPNAVSGERENNAERGGLQWPGSGVERERRDSRDHLTGSNERYLRESPVPHKAGGRSPRRALAENLAVYPYHTPQLGERGAEGPMAMKRKSPAWEKQCLKPSPVEAIPTLPYIRPHVDYASPRSAFEQHDLSTGMGRYAQRDVSGAGHFVVPSPTYYSQEPPIQRKGNIAPGGGDGPHPHYHPPPPREQKDHAPARYHHPGYFSDGQRSSALPGSQHRDGHSSEPIAREHQVSPCNWSTGGRYRWGEPRYDREHMHSGINNPRNRWKEDHGEGWMGRPERDVRLAVGHAYQPAIRRGINSEAESIRLDHGSRKGDYDSLPDSRRGGFKYGGSLPPSGKEPGKVAAALSNPSRGRAMAREEVAMGRGRREEPTEVQRAEQGSHQIRKRGGYSERLATDGQKRHEFHEIVVRNEPVRGWISTLAKNVSKTKCLATLPESTSAAL